MKEDMIALIVEDEVMARKDTSSKELWLKSRDAILESIKNHIPHKKGGTSIDSLQ